MNQQQINVPSGDVYIIREQDGRDDDNLSKLGQDEATVLNRHLASIILSGPDEKRLTLEDVEKLTLGDKYMILLKSRIFSLSDKLFFKYKWDPDSNHFEEYEVDLSEYVWDYINPFPEEGDPDYSHRRIPPQSIPTSLVKLTLSTGREVEFNLLDGVGERMLLGYKPNERTINKQLVARGLKTSDGTKMVTVKNFQVFSAREMVEIRAKVDELDPPIEGLLTIRNPDTSETLDLQLISLTDFFYPVKI